ncbi:short-chain dehydrogenase [Paramesorhizobium deserti]|uniref:Short-chain dehydrogenase n=1 Tax=Paramesorhizobium deserti TaxID=1494590 RepID=A0A135HZ51_9HYPH|nr:SDR family oxidoreductase [Paramesorhizobium deserti]KXF78459.1 short-chain dehydrogenase [Paramesorhizobium deserti]
MAGRLDGKVAIITGAGTGIGEAIAHKFAREGARLMLAGLRDDPVEDVARSIRENGGEVAVCSGNVSHEQTAHDCVDKTIDHFGRLDVLVNNAGVFLEVAECQDYSVPAFDVTVLNNVRSVFLMTKFALPHLQRTRGVVLSAGSESGHMGEGNNAPYGGTKGFVHAFMKGVAFEQGKYGVRANCVCPGPIDTAWTHKETGPMDEQMEQMTVAGTVLGRRGTPEEMANVYAFLASDEASYVTGALWYADGGTTIAKGGPGRQVPSTIAEQPQPTLPLEHSHDGLRNKQAKNRLH